MQEFNYCIHKAIIRHLNPETLETYQKELMGCIKSTQLGINKHLKQVSEGMEHIQQLQDLLEEVHKTSNKESL